MLDAGLADETGPALYVPCDSSLFRTQNLVMRVNGDPVSILNSIRNVSCHRSRSPAANVQTMDDRLRTAAGEPRFRTWLIGLFGLMGLVLAAIGIYGVLSYSVAQRRQEIGIRAALGATRAELIRMVLRECLTLTAFGAAIGLALSLSAGRFVRALLFEISPTDLMTLFGATTVLALIAVLSALLPARRAAAVDPNSALRAQ